MTLQLPAFRARPSWSRRARRASLPWTARTIFAALRSKWNLLRDLPEGIAVEISTGCNRRCWYCPQSRDPLPQQIISRSVWSLFLDRIEEARLGCRVQLAMWNELSLVPGSEAYVRDIVLAGYQPMLFTNGDRPEAIQRWLDAGARQILVTCHPPEKRGWRDALAPCLCSPYVSLREREILDNRAGLIPAPKDWQPKPSCFFPDWINVRLDGRVTLCILDYHSTWPIGDIRTQSFRAIWRSTEYRRMRRQVKHGQPAIPLCRACFGLATPSRPL